jgi:hypothetical protein
MVLISAAAITGCDVHKDSSSNYYNRMIFLINL